MAAAARREGSEGGVRTRAGRGRRSGRWWWRRGEAVLQQPRRGAALGRRLGLMAGEAAAAAAAARGGPGAGGGCRAGPGRAANPRSRSRTAEAEPARGWAGRGITCPQHAHVPPPRARAGRELEAAGGGCRARPHRGHAGGQVAHRPSVWALNSAVWRSEAG
ncbi:uncharacterized protein LOC107051583 isoform X1 [Gallus gallus]|uniref:uncharacterized protein LOC107051583 isoform X1 n=1 Tax=Gallus gallus TaxID=9031 RepID=UPI000739F5FD|nr:uncharacterized protein LOC107051583 isoform X1 [Gallus gallus]